jgi:serine/threonine protein kinase
LSLAVRLYQLTSYLTLRNDFIVRVTEREICKCKLLRSDPNVNIASYRGVQCKDVMKLAHDGSSIIIDTKRVMKLVFKKHYCDISDLVKRRHNIGVKYCLKSIAAGIMHMHGLDIVHSDIKPENIFAEMNTSRSSLHLHEFVVGDFDSAAATWSKFELKLSTRPLARQKRHDFVEEEGDWHAFHMVKVWLVQAIGGRLEDFHGIGKVIVSDKAQEETRH